MNKSELINAIAAESGLSKSDSKSALEAITNTITNQLAAGNSVQLVGFGTFSTGSRAARVGVNPSTGAAIQIPASTTVKFKPGKSFKDAVNK